jgi:post-segregation antitoxin (ccd killing protein)
MRLDHRVLDFVAMEAVKHQLASAWTQANAEAQQVPGRVLDQIKVGPASKSNVESLMNTARDYSINLSTDPMPALTDAIQARLSDHRKHYEAAIPSWAATLPYSCP